MNFGTKGGPQRPGFQFAPMVDVIFLLLIFFMAASVYSQLESELNITVPTSEAATPITRAPGEVIINIDKDGAYTVNQRQLTAEELESLLGDIAELYKGQPVIIRGDKKTGYDHIIRVLDLCAGADIWNISFAVFKAEEEAGH